MSRNRRPLRTLAGVAGAVALSGLLLSGCGTGQLSQTAQQVAATNGLNASVGDVDLRDVQIGYPQAPASEAALYARGTAAPVRATLINTGATADRLVSVSSPAAGSVAVGGDRVLAQDVALVAVGTSELQPTASRPLQLTLEGLRQPIAAGGDVPMTFVFERAGSITVTVPTGIPGEGRPGAEPERVEAEGGHGGGANGAETGVGGETGGEAEAPPVDQANPVPSGEGTESAPGNEGSGSGGAAGS
ncbi:MULTISPECIES: copper chaperone PCu(A)C [unclassified Pseudonocardia]|uniref:copper chaperone PCu(A)C n=1 Tax=unclassified Pseudonocardia TaxID=2619320 RepID=UPI00094B3D13|nr:copper chaperone PCu(A)C [Pseudonocardia sp. Ae707_Ps1]OLM21156.1 putative lipoprotein [Pseudonocardia sp. Ae707_Ps1]